jgi:hypothetical protein
MLLPGRSLYAGGTLYYIYVIYRPPDLDSLKAEIMTNLILLNSNKGDLFIQLFSIVTVCHTSRTIFANQTDTTELIFESVNSTTPLA